jgi:hypothetical protein
MRETAGGTSTSSGSGTPAFPGVWLRLVRSGNTFTGFSSGNGVNWSEQGSVAMDLPSTVYFGMAVTSHNTGATSTAQFRDLDMDGRVTVGRQFPKSGQAPGLMVWPNPVNTAVSIQLSAFSSRDVSISIYNINGELIEKLTAGSCRLKAAVTWNAAPYPAGLYIIKAALGNRMLARKILLSR